MSTELQRNLQKHPNTVRLSIGTRIDSERILRLADVEGPEQLRAIRKLRWLKISMAVRSLSWMYGVVVVVLPPVAVCVASIAFSTDLEGTWLFKCFSDSLVPFWTFCLAAWIYGFWLFGTLSPITELSRKARVIARVRRPEKGSLDRSLAIFVLQTSGAIGRTVFRISTGRTINVGVRPDLTGQAAEFAKEVMPPVPSGGADSLSVETVRQYDQFIRDVTGLMAIGESDKINPSDAECGLQGSDGLAKEIDNLMSSYLQPFAGQSMADTVVRYIIPPLALLVSIFALFYSL